MTLVNFVLSASYGLLLVGGFILINLDHRRHMQALRAAHEDRMWLIDLCDKAGNTALGILVIDTSFDAHIKARRRGEEWEWLALYPETIQNLVAPHKGPLLIEGKGKVMPFKRPFTRSETK